MAHSLASIEGSIKDEVPVRRALISVSDKTGIVELAECLATHGVHILSTGGTAKAIRDAGLPVTDVSEYTGSPEVLDGRVKTLHPKIHGGLLAVRGNSKHDQECSENHIEGIDLIVLNLYPFESTVSTGADFGTCVENIDIGGPSMLRSGAKNHNHVAVLTSPEQYEDFKQQLNSSKKWVSGKHTVSTTLQQRRIYAAEAFQLSAQYDTAIADYFAKQVIAPQQQGTQQTKQTGQTKQIEPKEPKEMEVCSEGTATSAAEPAPPAQQDLITRTYKPELILKYGCNPHQKPAAIYSLVQPSGEAGAAAGGTGTKTSNLPFTVLSGTPGYINLLDASYAWQLVRELKQTLGVPAAASFKHCSPAGAALGSVPLSAEECAAYEIDQPESLTPTALAYLRARNADPMCSFGDFAAVSHPVDLCTAKLLKTCVCDGIIAPSYEPEALAVLRAKKKGAFIVLQADETYTAPLVEYRELGGVVFSQRRNDALFTADLLANVVVAGKGLQEGAAATEDTTATATTTALLPEEAQRDLILASTAIKYTQSNSVGYALHGQMVGVGAGQQSRVDCVKLAGRKVATWYLRQHPKVQSLPFKATVKKQDRINARVRYTEGDITAAELPYWLECFETAPKPLTEAEKSDFLQSLKGVSLASDAFFPFRDSIDHASRYGVQYVAQPGGSNADQEVKDACAGYGMTMVFTDLRLFLH